MDQRTCTTAVTEQAHTCAHSITIPGLRIKLPSLEHNALVIYHGGPPTEVPRSSSTEHLGLQVALRALIQRIYSTATPTTTSTA
jgi:hypothetical protein